VIGKLVSGSSVGIVGGGPAGSFFALYLLKFARQRGLDLAVTVYEPKRFAEGGPRACNRSAGILSSSFLEDLKDLPLEIPARVVQTAVSGYMIHSPYGDVPLANPEPAVTPFIVFRGGGPLKLHGEDPQSFDGFLLETAQARGAKVIQKRVENVFLDPGPKIELEGQIAEYDLVVLACGINSASPKVSGLPYVEPRACVMAQDELYAGRETVSKRFGGMVHIFFFPGLNFVFGSLVPKGAFVNVSLLAKGCEPPSVDEFLDNPIVKKVLDFEYQRSCGCRGRAGVAPAGVACGDGFVAIGDACVSRLYKDGIGSALRTAHRAAATAVFEGISDTAFKHGYLPLIRAIDSDNRYGRLLFSFHQSFKDSGAFLQSQAQLVTNEQKSGKGPRPFSRVIWGMFTGSYSYRNIARMAFSPAAVAQLFAAMVRNKLKLKGGRP